MNKNAVIAVMVGIALLLGLGVWVKDASADAILFPWVVRSDDVTTVVSVVNTAQTDAEASGLPFHNNRIHVEYYYKMTTANGQEEKCDEYDFEVTSSKDDMVTWDIAGHFNGGLPMFNDTSNEVIAVPDMTLAVEDPRRAFLIVDNNTQALIDSSCFDRSDQCEGDSCGCNIDGTMYGEAVVVEHKTGAAWGYIAFNAEKGQKDPSDPDEQDLDFDDGDDTLGEAIGGDETTQTTLMNPNDAITKMFVTPVGTSDGSGNEDRDQRRGNWNTRVQLCRYPEINSDYDRPDEYYLPYTGDCNGGGIWNNEEGGFSFTEKKNIVCTTADEIVEFFGGAGTAAYSQWVASGKAGWAYIVVLSGNLDEINDTDDFEDDNEAIIGKLEYGTGLNWGGSIADTINTFVWLRDNGNYCSSNSEFCRGINIIHNEPADGLDFGGP